MRQPLGNFGERHHFSAVPPGPRRTARHPQPPACGPMRRKGQPVTTAATVLPQPSRRRFRGVPIAALRRHLLDWVRRHGSALKCAVALTAVASITLGLAWQTWQATVARSAARAAAEVSPSPSVPPSLVADLTRDVTRPSSAGRAPAAPSAGGAAENRSDGGQPTLGGPYVASGAVVIVLAMGATAARLVLRRYAGRRGPNGEAAGSPDARAEHDLPDRHSAAASAPDPGDADRPLQQETARQEPEPAQDPPPSPPAAQPAVAVVSGPAVTPHLLTIPGSLRAPRSAWLPDSEGADAPFAAQGQRLYERRNLTRIQYSAAGRLEWRDEAFAVAVLDLSEDGLRCRMDAAPTKRRSAAPRSGDYLRVVFPVVGGDVDLKAQVMWIRFEEGVALGLRFIQPSDSATQRLRATCQTGLPIPTN